MMAEAAGWLAGHTGDAARAEAYVMPMICSLLPAAPDPDVVAATSQIFSAKGGLNATLRIRLSPTCAELRQGLEALVVRLELPG